MLHAIQKMPAAALEVETKCGAARAKGCTDIEFLRQGRAKLVRLSRGYAWMDCGNYDAQLAASQYVQVIQNRPSVRVACLEEIALRMGFIDSETCCQLGDRMPQAEYACCITEISLRE